MWSFVVLYVEKTKQDAPAPCHDSMSILLAQVTSAESSTFIGWLLNVPETGKVDLPLLLRSQLFLWGSPFWCEIFAYVTVFFFSNPTIEVVTLRLLGNGVRSYVKS